MILGIDPGSRRVGIAVADRETRFARPVEVVEASDSVRRIVELATDLEVVTVVVGRPLSLSGKAGAAVESYTGFIAHLRAALPPGVTVVEHDERLTSVIAQRGLQGAGVSAKRSKTMVDAVAAQVMLQGYLDSTKSDS